LLKADSALGRTSFYNAIRPKAGNDTWLLQVKLTFQFPD
jgi:hypothetical protein